MKRSQRTSRKGGRGVPGYIVTFSDMVTLLLTFFVMLLSLATMQDPEIYSQGRDSFVESIEFFGLGMLCGRRPRPDFGNVKIKHFIDEPEKSFDERTIDAREEEIRRVFQELVRHMKTMPPRIVAKQTNFSVTDIRFSRGKADLNESAEGFLRRFVLDLQQSGDTRALKLYVLGLARDVKQEKKQWILSAERAQAVADFLQSELLSGFGLDGASGMSSGWLVYSWGAGPGGDWIGADSMASAQSQILIAVLRGVD